MPTKKKCDKVVYLITPNDFCATILPDETLLLNLSKPNRSFPTKEH